MNAEASFRKFGVRIKPGQAAEVREILEAEAARELEAGEGDTELMRLCSLQLFSLGLEEDILRIYTAKMSSMDAGISIETPLLCGPGLSRAKQFLERSGSPLAMQALKKIMKTESHGSSETFDRESIIAAAERYFGGYLT
jgi:hypothetical protein